jgi:hypothetical protein
MLVLVGMENPLGTRNPHIEVLLESSLHEQHLHYILEVLLRFLILRLDAGIEAQILELELVKPNFSVWMLTEFGTGNPSQFPWYSTTPAPPPLQYQAPHLGIAQNSITPASKQQHWYCRSIPFPSDLVFLDQFNSTT